MSENPSSQPGGNRLFTPRNIAPIVAIPTAVLAGVLIAREPSDQRDEHAIMETTAMFDNNCVRSLVSGGLDMSTDGTNLVFQLVSDTRGKLGDSFSDVCLCTLRTDRSLILCTGVRNFNERSTLLVEDPFTVGVDGSGHLTMNNYSPLSDLAALQAGAMSLDSVAKASEPSEITISNQESNAAESARNTLMMVGDSLYDAYVHQTTPTIPVYVDPVTGELTTEPPRSVQADPFSGTTDGGVDTFPTSNKPPA